MNNIVTFDTHNETIPYDKAVADGREIVADLQVKQWRLGIIADRIEPKYGDQTLARLAEAIGVHHKTLEVARSVARAWPKYFGRQNNSSPALGFNVASSLMAHPDREQIVRDNPYLTVTQARKIAREYAAALEEDNDDYGQEEKAINGNGKSSKESEWQMSFSNMAKEAISLPEYWDSHFDKWHSFRATPSMISLAHKAAATWSKIAADMSIKKG